MDLYNFNDDFSVGDYSLYDFFLRIVLSLPEDFSISHYSKLNITSILQETFKSDIRKTKTKKNKSIHFRSYSLDYSLSHVPILSNSAQFLTYLNRFRTKMRWNLVSLIDYFFQIHELLLSINFTNLISKIFSIIIDLIMMNEFEIIEGKLENTFFRVSTIEEHLQINVSPKLESALIKGSPNSPKYSLFFKRSESPQNSLMKINSNSALTRPNFNKNPKKKVRNLLAQLKYSMIPLLLLVQYRENYLDDDLEKKRHYEDSEKFQIFKDKTNSFYNQKKNSIIKKRDFVNKKKEEKEEGKDDYDIKNSKNLLSYCKKIITKWKKIAKMQEIKKEINVIREVLEKLENDMIVCNICRKMIPSKLFKDHSKLCNENDEMREELTRLLTSLKNEDFHWLDHTLRKVKNMIPNLKQQIAKLNENIEDPEIYVNQTIKPSLTRKPLISCPLFNPNFGPMIRKSVNPSQNIIIGYRDTVDVKNVKQSVKKFKALKKNRELKEMMKLKEMLEVGKEWQKTLFRINENIRHYRKLEITFKDESNNFCALLESNKKFLDNKIIDQAFKMHKKTEDIFLKFHDYFVMTKKLENEFSPSKRYSRTSIPTSFSPEKINRMNWLKESTYPKDKSSIFNEKTESQQFLHIINQSRRNSPYEIDFRKSFPSQEIFFSEKRKKAVEEVDLLFSNRKLSSQGESILLNEADSSKNISEGMKQSTSFVMLLNDSLSSSSSGDNRGKARERRLVSNENEDSWFSENYLRNKEENSEFIVRFFSCQEIEVELLTKPENTTTFNDFIFIKLISKGAFGRVWLVKRKITENYYAMKIINFADKMTNNNLNMLKNESQVYKILKGDQFVSAIFTFSHENFICFVMEYMYGGDLGALLQKEIYFSEETARFYIAEIIEAVETLHNIKIIHRDLKPDNVLIDRNGHLKLTDFGLSDLGVLIQKELCAKTLLDSSKDGNQFLNKMRFSSSEDIQHCFSDQIDKFPSQREINKEDFNQLKSHDNLSSDECFGGRISNKSVKSKSKVVNIVGTPDYMSPEVINGTSLKDPGIDWWSVGVILFEFLTGIPPFNDESPEKIFENILEHKIPWDNTNIGYEEGCITPEAQDLINKLLEKNPKKRLGSKGVNEIKNHIFFKEVDWDNLRQKTPEYVPIIENIKDTGNFERKKEYLEKEKENPLFAVETNSQQISEAMNMIKSTNSFHMKRIDMLYEENDKSLAKFEAKRREVKEELEKNESLLRKLESYQDNESITSFNNLGENI